MIYIKLDESMNLVMTKYEPIYRGDNLSRSVAFLIPVSVGDIMLESAAVYLSYIRSDGTADIALLEREEEAYNDRYFLYQLPVNTKLTRYAGEIVMFLQIFSGPHRDPVIAKSGECVLRVMESKDMDAYLGDRNIRAVYDVQRHMEDLLEQAKGALTERMDRTDEVLAAKADDIVFHEEDSTIQLVSTVTQTGEDGEEIEVKVPLGSPIFVRTDTGLSILDMEINEDGELVVTFSDETVRNFGRVVGKDGAVYVPHVDERKILTFTVEEAPTQVPDPVDLDPGDEWRDIAENSIGGQGGDTAYIWEDM